MSSLRAALALACVLWAVIAGRPTPGIAAPAGCSARSTRIHAIQGSGGSSPFLGRDVVVDAVVVGLFPGFPDGLGGFFVQEEDADADGDPATSEGLFVFDGGLDAGVEPGDRVRVRGRVAEFFGQTELSSVQEVIVCPRRGPASAARIRLPVSDPVEWEGWEGMRIRIDHTLVATGHHDLGRFGEVALAAGTRAWQPTHRAAPGLPALALRDRNARHRILLDDGSDAVDPEPVPYVERAGGGTLRLGDTVTRLEGVLAFAFGRFRVHPTEPVLFEAGDTRPARPPDVAGTLRLVAWNLGNHFNGDGRGGGFPTRGPRSPDELERQRAKLVETLVQLDPHVAVLVELENDGTGPDATLTQLVEALNRHTPGAPYAAIEPGAPRLGSHAIAVGLLYRPDAASPVGPAAILDARAHPDFDDTRNRPSLAQTFVARATGERFTIVANHFKSKGSPCDAARDPDLGDGQGECNATRTRAARALVAWLASDPTRAGDAPVIVAGDLNAYPREDPVRTIEATGYVDLLAWFAGPDAHTYVFDGEAGRLDHALARTDLLPFVGGAGVWHTNADEPRVLDYRSDDPAHDSPDPFRASDHDPLLVGLFPDTDGDGWADARDACPSSVLTAMVTLGSCDSGVPERLDGAGCTLADQLSLLRRAQPRRGHFLREAGRWLATRVDDGDLTRRERGALVACAARWISEAMRAPRRCAGDISSVKDPRRRQSRSPRPSRGRGPGGHRPSWRRGPG